MKNLIKKLTPSEIATLFAVIMFIGYVVLIIFEILNFKNKF